MKGSSKRRGARGRICVIQLDTLDVRLCFFFFLSQHRMVSSLVIMEFVFQVIDSTLISNESKRLIRIHIPSIRSRGQ